VLSPCGLSNIQDLAREIVPLYCSQFPSPQSCQCDCGDYGMGHGSFEFPQLGVWQELWAKYEGQEEKLKSLWWLFTLFTHRKIYDENGEVFGIGKSLRIDELSW